MPTYRLLALAHIDLQVTTIPRCLLLASRYVLHHAGSVGLGLVGVCCFRRLLSLSLSPHPPPPLTWACVGALLTLGSSCPWFTVCNALPAYLPVPRAFLPLGSWHFARPSFLPSSSWTFKLVITWLSKLYAPHLLSTRSFYIEIYYRMSEKYVVHINHAPFPPESGRKLCSRLNVLSLVSPGCCSYIS